MTAPASPEDRLAWLDANPPARAHFDALPPSHQREYLKWIEEAKRPETQSRRIEETARKVLSAERKVTSASGVTPPIESFHAQQ